MDGFKLRNIFNPVDLIVISYLFDTLILSFFVREPGGWIQPVLLRILTFITIGVVLYHDNSMHSPTSRKIRFFYPVILLIYLYGDTYSINHIFFTKPLDRYLVIVEQSVFGFQPSELFAKVMPQQWFAEIMNMSYFSYYIFIAGFAVAAFRHRESTKIMFLIISSFIFYYAFFIIFPTHGPQFYFYNGNLPETTGFFPKLVHFAQQIGEKPTGAFPSSHVGIMLIFCWLAFKYFRKALPLTIIFTLLITLATVYIKAHYAIDIIAGYISVPIIIFLSEKYYKLNMMILEE